MLIREPASQMIIFYHLIDEKHQKGKPNNKEYLRRNSVRGKPSSYTDPRSGHFVDHTNTISININEDLQLWLNDDNIITEATLTENFRCIISGPSEYGKTFLFKKLILASIYFDKLYIIGHTGNRYRETSCSADIGLERIYPKAVIEFIKDIKDLSSRNKQPKDLKKLMIFDDVRAKEPVINE